MTWVASPVPLEGRAYGVNGKPRCVEDRYGAGGEKVNAEGKQVCGKSPRVKWSAVCAANSAVLHGRDVRLFPPYMAIVPFTLSVDLMSARNKWRLLGRDGWKGQSDAE